MIDSASIFAPGFREQPYWWDVAPRPLLSQRPLPRQVDVAIVGSGHTGLSSALTLVRAGRSVAVFDSQDPGEGASSRNAGYVGRSLKHSFAQISEDEGLERAITVFRDMRAAFDYVLDLVQTEQIDCKLRQRGRFIAAQDQAQYDSMAREYELREKYLGEPFAMVSRERLASETGALGYFGGAVIPDHGTFHPGLYHQGLLDRVIAQGVEIHGRTPVTGLQRDGNEIIIKTTRGALRAREVIVAANGYVDKSLPWFQRRMVPFHGFMVATEPLPAEVVQHVSPQGRPFIEYTNNIFFMRPSPDESRILFGGLTGGPVSNLKAKAARLHKALGQLVPDLAAVRLSHVWSGKCAASFDLYPHIGRHDGVHYAMGYCFAGVPMGTWMGRKVALKLLDDRQGATAFDELPLRSPAWYGGNPWFVPLYMKYLDWQDGRL
jgi:glycine/D-amino acid oxidase-like deaminating enzyme